MAQAQIKVEGKSRYVCASCNEDHRRKDVAVDHIKPCGSLLGYADIAQFAENMFCEVGGLQILCKDCHYAKTMADRGMSAEDIKVAGFKKLIASKQKAVLAKKYKEVGSNQEQRVEQYRKTL